MSAPSDGTIDHGRVALRAQGKEQAIWLVERQDGGRDLFFFRHQKAEAGEESGDIFRIDAGFLQALKEKALSVSPEEQ
jgi:hypothetical protein